MPLGVADVSPGHRDHDPPIATQERLLSRLGGDGRRRHRERPRSSHRACRVHHKARPIARGDPRTRDFAAPDWRSRDAPLSRARVSTEAAFGLPDFCGSYRAWPRTACRFCPTVPTRSRSAPSACRSPNCAWARSPATSTSLRGRHRRVRVCWLAAACSEHFASIRRAASALAAARVWLRLSTRTRRRGAAGVLRHAGALLFRRMNDRHADRRRSAETNWRSTG